MSSISRKSWLVLTLAGLAVSLALVLKFTRYIDAGGYSADRLEQRLADALSQQDWMFEKTVAQRDSGEPYDKYLFRKAGCSGPLTIAAIGETDGLEPFLRQRYGNRVVYVQDGLVRQRPDIIGLQVNRVTRVMALSAARKATSKVPILAVVPPLTITDWQKQNCKHPTQKNWMQFYLSQSGIKKALPKSKT